MIRVTVYHMDVLKSKTLRDYHDTNLRKALITLRLTGAVAGMVMTIQSPVPTVPPVVITEGVDWTETGGDLRKSLLDLTAAIARDTLAMLTAVAPPRADGADWLIDLQVPSRGSWGESVTVDIDAAGANLELNGTPGPTTENLINGAGPDAVDEFQTFLNGLAGSPPISEIIIVPLVNESSSYLVIWDDVP